MIAAVCAVAAATLAACSGDGPPSSVFNSGGYHVRGDKVYYLNSFPGDAFEIDGADPASLQPLDQTYARDTSTVYYRGHPLNDADTATFELLGRFGARLLPQNRCGRGESADVPTRALGHPLRRDVDQLRAVAACVMRPTARRPSVGNKHTTQRRVSDIRTRRMRRWQRVRLSRACGRITPAEAG